MLTPKGYVPRLIDGQVQEFLETFGAVCIEGPKWCGKTWTALNHAESVYALGMADGGFEQRTLVELQPSIALNGARPRLIDEWQEVPALWDAVRMEVDKVRDKGQYILTGSATPMRKGILHSGAGRIGRLRMSTMTLFETGESDGSVSLWELFDAEEFQARTSRKVTLDELVFYCVRGGWPGSLGVAPNRVANLAKQYLQAIVENEIGHLDEKNRDKTKIRALLHSLGRNESTVVSNNTMLRDIALGDDSVSKETLSEYLSALERLFVIENLPAYSPMLRSSRRTLKMEKRHFADPSLAVAALGATSERLIQDLNTFGFIFEALCVHDLRIYAQSFGAQVFHYRDYKDNEIDVVVELPDGRWGAFEIKIGMRQVEDAAKHLLKMQSIFAKEGESPAVLCVISGLLGASYRRPDGVYVVPITALKP